ncbi:transmembrane protein [Ceratobasidium sp. AG-Ba]|nr:transmembrane protein [Ceratobasidium sp. AG-Ba]QRW12997.1 transmembrane protein [Ceratobasidium sp. AG-Ba]
MRVYASLGVQTPFDPTCSLVTSHVFSPGTLAAIRTALAVYSLTALIVNIVLQSVELDTIDSFFSYFTNLSYIGLCSYMWAASVQTIAYARHSRRFHTQSSARYEYPLQKWPRFLQFLHLLLWSTVTTFPFIVTVVYWVLLASSSTFQTRYSSWNNITVHAMNSGFALFEVLFTRAGPMPWTHVPFLIVLLGGYVGVAYITHATQGFYTYSFLDPKKQGAMLAAYIVGIAAGAVVVFSIVWCITWVRNRIWRRSELEKYGPRDGASDEVPMRETYHGKA